MNLSRVSHSGQITVPMEIRIALKLKEGDKVSFSKKENGEIVVSNMSLAAISEAQAAVAGSVYSEEDVLSDIMSMRYGEDWQS